MGCEERQIKKIEFFKLARGFTLIELLIVLAIIGILASIILVSINNARQEAKITTAKAQLRQIYNAINLLETDTGEWPGHKAPESIEPGVPNNEIWDLNGPENGLTATDGDYPNWSGPYILFAPIDPWGNPYFLDTDYDIDPTAGVKQAAVLGSFGPNGVGQNLYDSDDVILILKSS
jgi:general secretion pathway protein G